jgi:hypothetical protein
VPIVFSIISMALCGLCCRQAIKKSIDMPLYFDLRGCIQKFPDWPPGARTTKVQFSAIRCSCIAIL